jgi:hypothetical protein
VIVLRACRRATTHNDAFMRAGGWRDTSRKALVKDARTSTVRSHRSPSLLLLLRLDTDRGRLITCAAWDHRYVESFTTSSASSKVLLDLVFLGFPILSVPAPAPFPFSHFAFPQTGMGRIGKQLAHHMTHFGMSIIYTNRSGPLPPSLPHTPKNETNDPDWEHVTFDDLLARSDVISLNCPLTEETKGLLGKKVRLDVCLPSMRSREGYVRRDRKRREAKESERDTGFWIWDKGSWSGSYGGI